MFKIKTMNNISPSGIEVLTKKGCTVGPETERPEAMLIRSAELHGFAFNPELLAIARAAIADTPVLILDEATSSIDTRTEKIVQDGMDKLMAGRTTFVIAHRLSTIRNSDCIMVLDQGHIIERGSHEELIAEGGKYYQLYTGKIVNA